MSVHTIILAAGQGSRMKSNKAKVLQRIGGTSMLEKICHTAGAVSSDITLVVGFDKESVLEEAGNYNLNITSSLQPKPIGTGDAVRCGLDKVQNDSKVLVLYGDVPLIKRETLQNLIDSSNSGLSILTTVLDKPFGYGRVKTNSNNEALEIVEEKDATDEERQIQEIFTGVLCGSKALIEEGLSKITNNNAAGEFYLTDLVSVINEKGIRINTYKASNEEVKGANSKQELEQLEATYRTMQAEDLFEKGITISDASRLDVRGSVECGKDCSIDVNVILEGNIILGDNVSIGPNCIVKNANIGSNTKIEAFSHIDGAKIADNCVIGPLCKIKRGQPNRELC